MKTLSYQVPSCSRISSFDIPDAGYIAVSSYRSYLYRMMFEHLDCKNHDGLSYFVTFTFNDHSMARLYGSGRPAFFNYKFRDFINKSEFPTYLRKHGYSFRYIAVPEFGDGKGSRGAGLNPHYHVVFFLRPTSDCTKFFHRELNFLCLCKLCWNNLPVSSFLKTCGHLYFDVSSIPNGSSLPVGIVSYSNKGALVDSPKVFTYLSKYVLKSETNLSYTLDLRRAAYLFAFEQGLSYLFVSCHPRVNIESLGSSFISRWDIFQDKTLWPSVMNSLDSLIDSVVADLYPRFGVGECLKFHTSPCYSQYSDYEFVVYMINKLLSALFTKNDSLPVILDLSRFLVEKFPFFRCIYSFYYNLHSPKIRCSHHLGECALSHVVVEESKLDVSTVDPSAGSIPLPPYFFRKVYYNCVKHKPDLKDGKTIYCFIPNSNYNKLKHALFSYDCFKNFRVIVDDFLSSSFSPLKGVDLSSLSFDISTLFTAYLYYRRYSYDVSFTPLIESSDPLSYLRSLDFSYSSDLMLLTSYNVRSDCSLVSFVGHPYFNPLFEFLSSFDVSIHKLVSGFHRYQEVCRYSRDSFISRSRYASELSRISQSLNPSYVSV